MYQHIMVPLDGSELAECVLPHLDAIAGGGGVSRVTLVRVVEALSVPGEGRYLSPERERVLEQVKAATMDNARSYLDQIAKQLEHDGIKVKSEVLYGNVADELADYAKKKEVDLLIIATHGRSGVGRWVWGSVADRLLRSVCAPVFMVRAPGCFPGI